QAPDQRIGERRPHRPAGVGRAPRPQVARRRHVAHHAREREHGEGPEQKREDLLLAAGGDGGGHGVGWEALPGPQAGARLPGGRASEGPARGGVRLPGPAHRGCPALVGPARLATPGREPPARAVALLAGLALVPLVYALARRGAPGAAGCPPAGAALGALAIA